MNPSTSAATPLRHALKRPVSRPHQVARKPLKHKTLQRQRLRPLKSPSPVRVRTDEEGFPVMLHRKGKRLQVVAIRERWRIDDEWWRNPISREYYALVLEDGRPVIIFRDLVAGGWYGQ
jgi:hypothetical protein